MIPSIEGAARAVLQAEGVHGGEISISLIDDDTIADLHHRYLGLAGPTDVLSFDLNREDGAQGPHGEPLGDVYIGYQTATVQAEDHGVGLEEELMRLAIHGLLHILGHDHPVDGSREASPMYRRQEELLRACLDRQS